MKSLICVEKSQKLKCKWIMLLIFLFEMLVLFIYVSESGHNQNYSTIPPQVTNGEYINVTNHEQKFIHFPANNSNSSAGLSNKHYKSILIWNTPKLIETAIFGFGHEPFVRHGCEISDCVIFNQSSSSSGTSTSALKEFDAIIMHMSTIWSSDLPEHERPKYQRFIFFAQESPSSMVQSLPDIISMRNYFNWTMTYRTNSDIPFLYGRIEPETTAPKTREETLRLMQNFNRHHIENYAANKTKLAAWMVGHCDTPGLRELYVRQLAKWIPIDVYGRCGNLSCSRNNKHAYSDPECYRMLESKYKFYLSFENSICEEYVTEKFFEIMTRDIVPIVYGGADYNRIAPRHSFIDAMQFTPEALAQYLRILDANDGLYNEFFWWKRHYKVEAGLHQMARRGFCDLCKKLHQDQSASKYYPDLAAEWHPHKKCWKY